MITSFHQKGKIKHTTTGIIFTATGKKTIDFSHLVLYSYLIGNIKGVSEMKPLEIKGARTRLGLTQQYMADQLGISVDSYRKKERGIIKFTDPEKIQMMALLDLNMMQFNEFFYDGLLPIHGAGSASQAVF